MSTFIDYIRIKNNNNDDDFLHPITKEKAVIDDNGVRLDYKIDDITQRCENVEKKIHLVQTAKGTPNEIILDNIELVNGFYINFIIIENNDGLTIINGKPLYKPNTYQSPTLIKGEAVTAWYDSTNDCFFIKDSDRKTDLPNNLVYFSEEEHEPTSSIPKDSDLLGGEPKSYYEQLVHDVANRVTDNLNSINILTTFKNGINASTEVFDVNLLLDNGFYYIGAATINNPFASHLAGVVIVVGLAGTEKRLVQLAINSISIMIRYYNGIAWSGWITK